MPSLEEIKRVNSITNKMMATQSTGQVMSYPEQITLMPLQVCNYKCIMCNEWKAREKPEMSPELLEKIRHVLPFVRTLFITGGEPLMYRHLESLLSMGSEAGCDLWMVSNGALLDERRRDMLMTHGLKRLKISLDAAKNSTYKAIRGGNFFKVIRNIAQLYQTKVERGLEFPEVQLGFVAMRKNIAELPRLVVMASELGVKNIYVSYMGVQNEESIPESLYFYQDMSDEYMQAATEAAMRHGVLLELPPLFSAEPSPEHVFDRSSELCHEPWRNLFIRPDGRCNLCCGGGGGCGNLNETSFKEMWNHPARVHAREKVNTDTPPKLCLSCKTVKQTPQDIGTHFNNKRLREAALEWGEKTGLLPKNAA
ncbi:radical SAM protein [Salidesulfovibrio onnuriiensis]|uniref:radical SAM protein n=1 Tax=Salidesulfovibrio onnuriiensis TaxID=2583823 RepID=UPI0011CBF7D6|nr:radical SAM protein [Salidesulfovibrio onnuriiensis]